MLTYERTKQNVLKQIEARQKAAAYMREREICAATARGNISLQWGEYFTPEDTEALKNELVDYYLPNRHK